MSIRKLNDLKYYMTDISKNALLTAEEEKDLALRMANGDTSAKNKLIEHNLRLVVSIAIVFQGNGLQLADLIQEEGLEV